jgi:hypothetical protein
MKNFDECFVGEEKEMTLEDDKARFDGKKIINKRVGQARGKGPVFHWVVVEDTRDMFGKVMTLHIAHKCGKEFYDSVQINILE